MNKIHLITSTKTSKELEVIIVSDIFHKDGVVSIMPRLFPQDEDPTIVLARYGEELLERISALHNQLVVEQSRTAKAFRAKKHIVRNMKIARIKDDKANFSEALSRLINEEGWED